MSFISKEAYDDLQQRYIQATDMLRRIVAEYKRSDEDARGVSTVEYLVEESEHLTDAIWNVKEQHTGRFEVCVDEDTGRRFWWGGEDGWKNSTEIGENGVLTIDAAHFAVGTEIILREPVDSVLPTHERIDEQTAISALSKQPSTAS